MATREEVDAWLKPQGYKLKDGAEGSWTPGRSWWDRYIENAVKVSGASIAKGVGGIVQSVGESILDDRPFYQQALEEYGVEGVPSPEDLAGGQAPHGATGTWGKTIDEKISEPEGLSEIVGSFVTRTGKSVADSASEIIERLRPREDASWLEKTGFEVLHNVGVNAPGLAASIITKKPVYGLATLGGVSYGNKYTDERKLGATPDEAHQRASAAAGSEVATELVPISVILKPGLKLTQRIGYNILSEILGENVNTAYEMMQDRAIHNPDMPLGDFITQELLPAFGNTTKVSALSSFIMGAAAHPFTRGTPRIEQSNKQKVPGIETARPEIKEVGEVKIESPSQPISPKEEISVADKAITQPEKSAEVPQTATTSIPKLQSTILDAMVADQKITAEDAKEISSLVSEHSWTDKEIQDFVKIANNLGATTETEKNNVSNALFISLLKQEVYKKNEEKYKWEIAANEKTISNLVKTLKIRGGSPESVKLNVDNVLGTSDEFAKVKTPEELYKVIDETFGKSKTFKKFRTREIQNLAAAMLTESKEGKKITRLEDIDQDAIDILANKSKLEKIRNTEPGTVLNAREQRAAEYIKNYMAERAHGIADMYKQAQNRQEKDELLDAFSEAIDDFLEIDLIEQGSSSEGALAQRVKQMQLSEGVLPNVDKIRIPSKEEMEKIRNLPKDKKLMILEIFDNAKTQAEQDDLTKQLTESFGRNLFETINQIWINGLLSAPPTHAVNLSSGIYTALSAPVERYFAEKIGGGGIAKGEAARLLYGEYMAFWDSLKAARQMWKTGKSLLTNQTKWEIHRTDRLTSRNANIMLNKLGFGNMNETLAKVVDFMGKSILNLPVRGLITADEFFKVLNYKADIYAIAHRKVTNKILEGKLDAKDAAKQTAIEAASPTYEMKDEAMLFAREQTMSRPDGTVTKILNTIIDRFPPAKIIVPFRIAPESIVKYGLERFPALNMVHHETRNNLFGRNGAVARDMELGKMAFGGSVLGTVWLLALAGFITGGGPRDPELRKAWLEKNKPYSLNFGSGYSFSFKRFDFMLFGLVADLSEIAYHASDTELAKTGVAIWYALKNNLVDRQYLDGIMNVIDAFDRGGNAAYNYVKNLSGSGIPAIVALGAKATDPVVRDVVTIMDRLQSRIPGMSDNLPAARNLYGEKTMHSPTFGSIWVSPILMGVKNNDPVYDEIIKNQVEISYPERYVEGTNPGRFPSLSTQRTGHGVALTPQQYEQLMIYFGEGMKEDLTNAINSDTYKEGSEGVDGRQAAIIRSVINQHKENARSRLIYETESLQKQIYEKKQRKYEALNR